MTKGKPVVTSPSRAIPGQRLSGSLSVGSIVFLVLAAAAPLAVIAALTPLTIVVSENPAVPAYFLIATGVLVLFSVGFTRMARDLDQSGGFFTYIRAGLGPRVGAASATLALVAYTFFTVAVAGQMGGVFHAATQRFLGVALPWWVGALATLLIVGILGYRNIDLSSKVLGVLLSAEVVIVIVVDVAILLQGGEGLSLQPFGTTAFTQGSPWLGIMFAFFGFLGFESTVIFRDEAKDPARTIPRATYIAVISIGLFYSFSTWLVVSGLGMDRAVEQATKHPEEIVVMLAEQYAGVIVSDVLQVLLVTSLFACILTIHNVVARYQRTVAAEGMLHARLSAVHPRHGAPSSSSLVISLITGAMVIAAAVLGLDPNLQLYAWLSGAATLAIVVLMAATGIAVVTYYAKRGVASVWHERIAPLVSSALLVVLAAMVIVNFPTLIGDPVAAILVGGTLLVAAAWGFVANRVASRRLRGGDRTEPPSVSAR
jgi:amino acid transporter